LRAKGWGVEADYFPTLASALYATGKKEAANQVWAYYFDSLKKQTNEMFRKEWQYKTLSDSLSNFPELIPMAAVVANVLGNSDYKAEIFAGLGRKSIEAGKIKDGLACLEQPAAALHQKSCATKSPLRYPRLKTDTGPALGSGDDMAEDSQLAP
jgi:hypothetical protein